jgi:hypothetical protein
LAKKKKIVTAKVTLQRFSLGQVGFSIGSRHNLLKGLVQSLKGPLV